MNDLDELLSKVDDTDDYERTIQGQIDSESVAEETSLSSAPVPEERAPQADNMPPPVDEQEALPQSIDEIENDVSALDTFAEPPAKFDRGLAADEIAFTLRGTRPWNTREPYLITIDYGTLGLEKKHLKSSFYFIRENLDDVTLKEAIRENLLLFVRRPGQNITAELEQFFFTEIISEKEKIVTQLQFDNELKNVFIYHCGPLTFYKMLMAHFQFRKTGYCYRFEPGNRSVRFFPESLLKVMILRWFEENINVLDLPFDNITHFNEIKTSIAKKYSIETKKFLKKLEQINSQLGPEKRISGDKLLSLKGDDLFGLSAIEVYKRFIDRTIFHRGM